MLKGLTWEEETRARIDRAKAEQSKAKDAFQHWTDRVEALEKALLLELHGSNGSKPQKDLASMSVNNALIEIAREHGGVVVTKQAIELLVKAGVFSTRGEANDNIHSTVRRSKDFRKDQTRKGVYHLIAGNEQSQLSPRHTQTDEHSPRLSDIVGRFVAEHPEWGNKDLVKAVKQTGYDFQGKRPAQAVNMARVVLRKGKTIKIPTQMTLSGQLT